MYTPLQLYKGGEVDASYLLIFKEQLKFYVSYSI